MEIYANFIQKVQIDPKDVIKKLIDYEIGHGWIFEKDNKYYKGFEQSAGCHSYDSEKEITRETYEYVTALQLILKWMQTRTV